MWRYVGLCGAIPKVEKTKLFSILLFLLFSANLQKQAWRYVALSQNLKKQSFSSFLLFSANFGKKEAWRYVAVSQNPKKHVFQQNVVGLCGVAPRLQFSANVKNSRGAMWCIQKNPKTKLFSMLFLLFSTHVSKILVALCGGCPTLRNDHVFHFGINGLRLLQHGFKFYFSGFVGR